MNKFPSFLSLFFKDLFESPTFSHVLIFGEVLIRDLISSKKKNSKNLYINFNTFNFFIKETNCLHPSKICHDSSLHKHVTI